MNYYFLVFLVLVGSSLHGGKTVIRNSLQFSISWACVSATARPVDTSRSNKIMQNYSKRLAFALAKVGLHSHAIAVSKCRNATCEDIIDIYYSISLIPRRLYLRGWNLRCYDGR